jgi:hypothetical protein
MGLKSTSTTGGEAGLAFFGSSSFNFKGSIYTLGIILGCPFLTVMISASYLTF